MKKTALIFISFCSLLFACNSGDDEQTDSVTSTNSTSPTTTAAPKGKMQQVEWMVGSWEMRQPEGILTETWKVASDTEMTGTSVMVSEKAELLFSERMRLVLRGNELWYLVTVSNQNNGQEVPFKEKSFTNGELIFENAAHDFPQRILYKEKAANVMYARIEGTQDGLGRKEEFEYNKVLNQ
jgi:hypothetical protein